MTAPRRIDRPVVPVHKPPVAARPATPVAGARSPLELAGQDRFRRTLGALRRDAPQASLDAPLCNDASPPVFADVARASAWDGSFISAIDESPTDARPDPRDDAPADDSDDGNGDSPRDSSSEPAPHEAVPPGTEPAPAPWLAAPRGREGLHGDEHPSPTKAVEGVAAVDATQGTPAWLVETARQIEWLCARTDPAFQTWSVTVPMDPTTLPETELALSLSHFSLTLRFRTRSEQSAVLVSKHRSQLQTLLEKLPALPQNIDIDLE